MRYTFLWISCSSLLACRSKEDGLKAYNSLPQITIQSHSDGAILLEGQVENFYALATDSNNSPDELEVAWFYDGELVCDWTPPDAGGSSNCDITPDATKTLVRAEVRDPENAGGRAEIEVDVQPSFAPEVTIISPDTQTRYVVNELVHFSAQLSDTEDPVESLVAEWQSSIDGVLEINTTPDSSGQISDYTLLSAGEHVISLRVSDSMGKSTIEELIISVEEANIEPQCSITAPPNGSSGEEGRNVIFEGLVSDEDGSLSDLRVTWISDRDGTLGTSIASSNGDGTGSVIFSNNRLSINSHIITMQVEDADGGICNSNILYTVGSPPSIVLIRPNNSVFAQNENIVFEAEITDGQDVPSAISVEWYSDRDGVFSTTGPNSSDIAQFNYSLLSLGVHNITITATDSDGLYDTVLTSLRINSVPTQPTISLTPQPAYTTDTVSVVATGSTDADNDPVTYIYQWSVNGSVSSYTSNTIPNLATTKGETWTVRVTPTDGYSNGPYRESSLSILNSPPVVSVVNITPTAPTTQSTLNCSYVSSDADGDIVTVAYNWLINGNLDVNTTNSISGPFSAGDTITCRVTPNDGSTLGTPTDASVVIGNSAPIIQSLTLAPSTIYTNDTIIATASVSDPENDPLSYTWNWYVDSGTGFVQVQSTTGSVASSSLDGTQYFDKNDSVYVDLIVSDGSVSVTSTSATTIVNNTPPSVFNAFISPIGPVAGVDDLECYAQSSDVDGDSVTLQYSWRVNGSTTPHTSAIISTSLISNGEVWECTITCNDGTIAGNSISAITTIGANVGDAVGHSFCASADNLTDATTDLQTCLSDQSLSSGEISNGSYTLQLGTHYVYTPE